MAKRTTKKQTPKKVRVIKQKAQPKATTKKEVKKAPLRKAAQPEGKEQYLLVANWKMNPETALEARTIFTDIKDRSRALRETHLVVCPPAPFIGELRGRYSGKKLSFGAQTCFAETRGSFTGEVSAPMIKSVGGTYVIVGHSERRAMGETDEDVRARINAVLEADLTPIVCIGETERDSDGEYLSVIREQIRALFSGMSRDWLARVVIAYEPIWAVGKNSKRAVTTHELHETSIYIRKVFAEMFDKTIAIKQRILYGGSVDHQNAAALIDGTQIDGFLVGRASLDAESFLGIADAIEMYAKR